MASGKALNVFVSSTSEDLKVYREVARDAILEQGWMPRMMEYEGASHLPTVEECQRRVDGSDLVLLLVAYRRGWVPTTEQGGDGERSITVLELDYARSRRIPVLMMRADDN